MTDPFKDIKEMMKPMTEMSESLMKNMEEQLQPVKEKFKPAVDMAEVNKTTAEKLFTLQSEYVTDFVNSSLAQFKALIDAKDPKEALHLQVEFFKTLDSKFTEVAEQELAALTEAKDKLADIIEKSLSDIGDVPFMQDLSKFDLAQFDLSKLMPVNAPVSAEKPKTAAASKPAPARKTSAPAAAKVEAAKPEDTKPAE
ncbi:phasin family protein [Nitrincola tapanii]|uniref:Phasin family protein n=1 Tax=Nitrincola tapanii TaxID=1708751 RepID=A0A5A9W4G2_9GAMM|nr:phasin family protein [Nitrincola tapanii]KAA0875403.1 phasin family protein [Nitrincola tapanii]